VTIPKWTGHLVGKMHNNSISNNDLASKLGYTNDYVSMVLNGKRTPKGARERFEKAVDEIIKERVE
jgi:hypothetical protein